MVTVSAATIVAETRTPEFANPGQKSITRGEFGSFYRKQNAIGANLSLTYATENLSVTYRGAAVQADNYKAADDFKTFSATGIPGHTLPLNEVGSTAYESWTHNLDLACGNSRYSVPSQAGVSGHSLPALPEPVDGHAEQ